MQNSNLSWLSTCSSQFYNLGLFSRSWESPKLQEKVVFACNKYQYDEILKHLLFLLMLWRCALSSLHENDPNSDTLLNVPQDEPTVHVLYPLLYMHGIYSNMIDKVYRHMEVSWSVFMQADNGQLVVVRSEPHATLFQAIWKVSWEVCLSLYGRERVGDVMTCWSVWFTVDRQ